VATIDTVFYFMGVYPDMSMYDV